jgi:hypothetical protein
VHAAKILVWEMIGNIMAVVFQAMAGQAGTRWQVSSTRAVAEWKEIGSGNGATDVSHAAPSLASVATWMHCKGIGNCLTLSSLTTMGSCKLLTTSEVAVTEVECHWYVLPYMIGHRAFQNMKCSIVIMKVINTNEMVKGRCSSRLWTRAVDLHPWPEHSRILRPP